MRKMKGRGGGKIKKEKRRIVNKKGVVFVDMKKKNTKEGKGLQSTRHVLKSTGCTNSLRAICAAKSVPDRGKSWNHD